MGSSRAFPTRTTGTRCPLPSPLLAAASAMTYNPGDEHTDRYF